MLAAVVDRVDGACFGLSYGDSSIVTVDHDGARRRSVPGPGFVDPRDPATLDPSRARPFRFETGDAQLVLAFTDGIDQCHYRSPATSIGPGHIHRLFVRTGPKPRAFAAALADLALAGVDGHPGGQDNLALTVVTSR